MLISILAGLLGFHIVTIERSASMQITILISSQCGTEPDGPFLAALLCVVAENMVADRWTTKIADCFNTNTHSFRTHTP